MTRLKTLFTLGLIVICTGCGRSVTSGPSDAGKASNLKKWVVDIKNEQPNQKQPALPTLNRVEVFSYKEQGLKTLDPNSQTATMRAELSQGAPNNQGQENSEQNPKGEQSPSSDTKKGSSAEQTTKSTSTPENLSENPSAETATSTPVTYLRNPFGIPTQDSGEGSSLRPDPQRPRQPLEAFTLDSLKMVGTLGEGGRVGLVITPDKVTYRVGVGQYLGQQDGRVVSVDVDKIVLVEIVPDGQGGWEQREASLVLE